MKASRLIARVIAVAGLALLAQAPPARAMLIVATAPAVHTAAGAHHARARHPLHRRLHRRGRAVRAQLTRHRAAARTAPATPRKLPHRAERRAALPGPLREHRGPHGSRDGHAMTTPATLGPIEIAVRRLDQRQNETPSGFDNPVTSGRGPPRAGPAEDPLPGPARPTLSPRSAAPSIVSSLPLPIAPPPDRTAPRPRVPAAFSILPVVPEPVFGRSHVRRPEGAAACSDLPSRGEAR